MSDFLFQSLCVSPWFPSPRFFSPWAVVEAQILFSIPHGISAPDQVNYYFPKLAVELEATTAIS